MGNLRGRIEKLIVRIGAGKLWDGTTLNDVRNHLKARCEGRPTSPGRATGGRPR